MHERRAVRLAAAFIVAALLGVAACSGKSGDRPTDPPIDPPQVPTSLIANNSTSFAGTVGSTATTIPTVTLRDAKNNVIAGTVVRFVVSGGGTIINDSTRTDASGVATSGAWTLGKTTGSQTVVASSSGLTPVTFTVVAAPSAAVKVVNLVTASQQGVVNVAVPIAPAVRVFDQYDNAVPGVAVTFVITAGGGSITGAQKTTGADGSATADAWILGTVPGTQRARADVAGITGSVTYTTVASAGAASRLTLVGGNGGSGVSNSALEAFATLPSVSVTDAFGNPVAGVSVTFTPGVNSGTVAGSPAISNALGIAAPTSWVLGNVAAQTLTASSTAIPGAQVVFTATALVTAFDITVRYIDGAPSARQQLAVSRAISKWRSVIVGNIGASRVKLDAQNCGRNWTPAIDETVTNVLILARIGPIDGVGGIAGDAGPCVLHSSSGLTSLGTMMFDSADLASLESSGLIDGVVAHEMGHVLGVGTIWTEKNLVTDLNTADPIFTGTAAKQEFALLLSGYSGRPVPVENAGGPGATGGHWRESVFRNELMTSVINSGTNPLSRVTVASLKDIGYDISFIGADAFSITSQLMSSASPFGVQWSNDIHVTSLFTTDRQGRLSPWKPLQR